MKVADLFINLGVTGDSKAKEALGGISKGLEGVIDSSLVAKASILAVVYGMEQMLASSGQAGVNLKNFSVSTGIAAEKVQYIANALRPFNVSMEEVQNTLLGLADVSAQFTAKGTLPEFFRIFAASVHASAEDLKDPVKMLEKMREFAHKGGDPNILRMVMGGLHAGPNMFQALSREAANLNNVKVGNILGEGQIDSLDKMNAALKELFYNLDFLKNKLASKYGFAIATEFLQAEKSAEKFVNDLTHLTAEAKILRDVFIGIAAIWAPITASILVVVGLLSKMNEHEKDTSGFWHLLNKKDFDKDIGAWFKDTFTKKENQPGSPEQVDNTVSKALNDFHSRGVAPKVDEGKTTTIHQKTENNVKVDANLHGVPHAEEGSKHLSHHVKRALSNLQTGSVAG